jgi:hypothetical protein
MKRATLILLAAVGMLLGTGKLARAADYSGDCAGVSSWDGSGNADITDPGNCTISNDLSATGYINITASGTVNTQALTAADGYIVVLGGGTVTVGGDITTNAWSVIVSSPSDISLQNVYTSGTGYHDVRILAHNAGSGSNQFVIGSAGAANGVGIIDASNDDGFDNIYISNGASGGISYSGTGILDVSADGGQAGRITLDTEDGTGNIVLNGGTIEADGSGYPAGDINLVTSASGAIVVSSDTTLSVQGSGPYPFIDLSSDTITLNANLTISMSGGNIADNGEIGGITPNGSASIVAPTDPDAAIYFTPWVESNNNLSITGTGTLAWTATGDYTALSFAGNNLIITANVIVHNTGNGVSTYLSSNDSSFNAQPITIGNVQLYANSSTSGDTAGTVTLGASQLTSITGPVLLDASGTGGGDGGTVYFFPGNGSVPFGASGGNYFQANVNGSSTGGNAGLFETWGNGSAAYNVSFQTANGITASAQSSDGNGGSVTINSDDLNFALSNASLHADGVGAGNGGTINISNSTMEFTGTTSSITANGAGTSSGGSPTNGITIWTGSSLNLGSGTAGDVLLSANALSSGGTGGNIAVTAGEISADDGSITVTAGSTGNGGTISVTSFDQLDISGTLDASGGTTSGNGGVITLNAYNIVNSTSPTNVVANSHSGNGGQLTIASDNDLTIDSDDFKFSAVGSGTGNGGSISVAAFNINVTDGTSARLTVTAGTTGNGGTINLIADPEEGTVGLIDNLDASGGTTSGDGGTINISGSDITSDGESLTFSANAPGSGDGGEITITSGSEFDIDADDFQINANGADDGDGGTITITALDVSITNDDAELTVTAGDNGNGGTISITGDPDSGTVELAGTVDASAGADGDGDGGNITISSFDLSVDSDIMITANGEGEGTGGSIELSAMDTDSPIDLSGSQQIIAMGGSSSGNGGSVSIWNPGTFNVVGVVNIRPAGGSTGCCSMAARSGATAHDTGGVGGFISIGNPDVSTSSLTTCQQFGTGSDTWPTEFYDCTGKTTPSGIQVAAAQGLNSAVQAVVGSTPPAGAQATALFTFSNATSASSGDDFFNLNAIGCSVDELSLGETCAILGNVYSSVFENNFVSNTYRETETSVHELGHALDLTTDLTSGSYLSADTVYNEYVTNDFLYLDYSSLGTDEMSSTYRDPCNSTGPLAEMIDETTGSSFCTSGTLNDPNHVYGGLTNSGILQASDPHIFQRQTSPTPWYELYAQSFAFAQYAYGNIGTISNLTHATADTAFGTNLPTFTYPYLTCTYDWAEAVANGGFTPPTGPSNCTMTVPTWYTPFGSKTH